MEEEPKDFTKLHVWQRSHQLVIDAYRFCEITPKAEDYITTSQLKRSVSSVPANIAEGYGRYYYQDNISFCRKARGSLYETKNHLIKIRDLKLVDREQSQNLINECDEIMRLLNGYIRHLEKRKLTKPLIN
jgi:four helix bundle protein